MRPRGLLVLLVLMVFCFCQAKRDISDSTAMETDQDPMKFVKGLASEFVRKSGMPWMQLDSVSPEEDGPPKTRNSYNETNSSFVQKLDGSEKVGPLAGGGKSTDPDSGLDEAMKTGAVSDRPFKAVLPDVEQFVVRTLLPIRHAVATQWDQRDAYKQAVQAKRDDIQKNPAKVGQEFLNHVQAQQEEFRKNPAKMRNPSNWRLQIEAPTMPSRSELEDLGHETISEKMITLKADRAKQKALTATDNARRNKQRELLDQKAREREIDKSGEGPKKDPWMQWAKAKRESLLAAEKGKKGQAAKRMGQPERNRGRGNRWGGGRGGRGRGSKEVIADVQEVIDRHRSQEEDLKPVRESLDDLNKRLKKVEKGHDQRHEDHRHEEHQRREEDQRREQEDQRREEEHQRREQEDQRREEQRQKDQSQEERQKEEQHKRDEQHEQERQKEERQKEVKRAEEHKQEMRKRAEQQHEQKMRDTAAHVIKANEVLKNLKEVKPQEQDSDMVEHNIHP